MWRWKIEKGVEVYTTHFLLLERDTMENFHILLSVCFYCLNILRCDVCINQKSKDKQFVKTYLLPRKWLGSFCFQDKFDQTHCRVQDKYKPPIWSNKNTCCLPCQECFQIWLTPSLPSTFPLKHHLTWGTSLDFSI